MKSTARSRTTFATHFIECLKSSRAYPGPGGDVILVFGILFEKKIGWYAERKGHARDNSAKSSATHIKDDGLFA